MPTKNSWQTMKSHLKQFKTPLYSTEAFYKFLNKHKAFKSKTIFDIGCGCGAVTNYFASRQLGVKFVGGDYNQSLINIGKSIPQNKQLDNLKLKKADLFNLKETEAYDGIYNVHTLCCFKRFEPVVDQLLGLKPDWLAFNSLFYDGPLDVLIHIRNHEDTDLKDNDDFPDADFNTFSLPRFRQYLAKKGYKEFYSERFEIPKKLPKPPKGRQGTYTMKTELGRRTQFSGPVHLPWHFVLARKK